MAHTFLALAYGKLEPPGKQEVLEEGELALSYFTEMDRIDSQDLRSMEYIKYVLRIAYERAFPEKMEMDLKNLWKNMGRTKHEKMEQVLGGYIYYSIFGDIRMPEATESYYTCGEVCK